MLCAISKRWLRFFCLAFVFVAEARAQELVLTGSSLPESQAWSAFTLIENPEVSTDGSVITISTMGTQIPDNFLLYHKNIGAARGYAVEFRLRVLAIEGVHDPFDAGLVFYGSYTEFFGTQSDRSQMIFFDPGLIGWGDNSQTAVVDTLGGFHTYRLEVDVDGSARFYVDGVQVLSRSSFAVVGSIAFGDMANGDPPQSSRFQIESIVVWRDCNQNGVGDEIDVSSGTSEDCNADGRPDECETDCDGNAIPDECDLAGGDAFDCNNNDIPDECETDCNGNGILDSCDIYTFETSEDCDSNQVPDECQPDPDCNANSSPDFCDVISGSSEDCNDNMVPDECEPGPDCNGNGVADLCDIGSGSSEDCNANQIPDECDLDAGAPDCNANSVPDSCELQFDCNDNQVPDACDLASGVLHDENEDGYPDECIVGDIAGVLPDPTGIEKSKFITFVIPNDAGPHTALRVWFLELHRVNPPYSASATIPFNLFEGRSVWVGPPATYVESAASQIPFKAARTQCTPHYQNWTTVGLLHVTGSHVVPSSRYWVQQVSIACQGQEDDCLEASPPLEIGTTRWTDAISPQSPPSPTVQPDLGDVSAMVNKFRGAPGAIIKARALVTPSNVFGEITVAQLTNDVGFGPIASTVDGFRCFAYPARMGKCAGSNVGCANHSDCGANGPCELYCPD